MARDIQKRLTGIIRHVELIPGWSVTPTKNGHWKFTAPSGRVHFTGSSPSDPRAIKNVASALRQMGAKGVRH